MDVKMQERYDRYDSTDLWFQQEEIQIVDLLLRAATILPATCFINESLLYCEQRLLCADRSAAGILGMGIT